MPWMPVPMFGAPMENFEEIELDQTCASVIDGYVNELDHIYMRPGYTQWLDTGTGLPIDGLFWWDEQRVVLVVSNQRVWKITDAAGTMTEITGSTALMPSANCTFANTHTTAWIANGAQMVTTDLNTLTTVPNANAPTHVTHVGYLDGYILALDPTLNLIYFTDPIDQTLWNALDFFAANGEPDVTLAMKIGFREVVLCGRTSVEFWFDDAVTPFARIDGSVQSYGISAPYSLTQVGNTWMWLDHTRRFVNMEGRAVQYKSSPYDKVIQRYASVDDAIGYTMSVDGYPLYILNFPTAGQSLVYNWKTDKWSKWGSWNPATATYGRFQGNQYCYARYWNTHLIGDPQGRIHKLSRTVFTDNGASIRTLVRTGHINHQLDATKRSNHLRVKLKRGAGNANVQTPQVSMRRRVNNGAQWSNERWASLGEVGQHEQMFSWRRNGVYRTCQYEFVHTDNSDFVLIGAQENIEALGR